MRRHRFGAALCAILLLASTGLAQENTGADPFQAQLKLCKAIADGDAAAVTAALDAGANLAQICPEQMTYPLHHAVDVGKPDIVALLLDRGADVNQPDNGVSATPLHYAAAKEDPALVSLLLKRGAEVDKTTDEGLTALAVAVQSQDNPAVAQALIDAGADVNAADDQGDTLLDMAREQGRSKVAALLESKGAKPGEEPGAPASGTAPAAAEGGNPAPESPPVTDNRTTDGQLVFKGLYVGMPVEAAGARLTQLGYPPETYDEKKQTDVPDVPERGYLVRQRGGLIWWEIWYDETTQRVYKFHFAKVAVDKLFNCADMDAEQFARAFVEAYGLPGMEFVYARRWGYEYTDPAGWKVRIDDDKTLIVSAVASASQRGFD